MRNTIRVKDYPLIQKAFVDLFAAEFPEDATIMYQQGLLGPHPFHRRGDIILCVDHCKTGGDLVGEGFALNCVDCETRELIHQVCAMPSPSAMSLFGHVENANAVSSVLFGMPSPFAFSSVLFGMPSPIVSD